jgi:hypothetical protein
VVTGFRTRSCSSQKPERDDGSKKCHRVPSTARVAGFACARTPQCSAGPFAALGAACVDGGGPICCGGWGGALRAAARGAGRRGAAGAAAGAAGGVGFVSGGAPGSGVMMLTGGIEEAEGKSYFGDTGTAAVVAGAAGAAGGADAVV